MFYSAISRSLAQHLKSEKNNKEAAKNIMKRDLTSMMNIETDAARPPYISSSEEAL